MATKGGEIEFEFKGDSKDLDKNLKENEKKINKISSNIASGLKKSISGITKGIIASTASVSAVFEGLVTASVNARGELEQQVGGIKTLFVNELGNASEVVIANANKAYKTAGLSAIDYMKTATSFSASLLQSLGNDTIKAAEVTDMAIIDMSDNANKMGTAIESIQDAYQRIC